MNCMSEAFIKAIFFKGRKRIDGDDNKTTTEACQEDSLNEYM